jgi:WbqC-like protein family.
MTTALIELHYLPTLEYFCAVISCEEVLLEKHEHYIKQSYRNRTFINTAQGPEMLVVPLTGKHGKVAIHQVQIDYAQKWQNNHWRTIESAYRKAPFFEFYADDLKEILYRKYESLFDLNKALLSFCLRSIPLSLKLSESVAYEKNPISPILDLRSQIDAKKHYSGRSFYSPVPYYQVFGNAFASNLSVVDLLFCMGPQTRHIINASQPKN